MRHPKGCHLHVDDSQTESITGVAVECTSLPLKAH